MKENKNIDRLFQEKFKNFEVHPSDKVWSRIAATQEKKKDRKVIPFWWRIGGIAAALLLLFTVGSVLLNSEETVKSTIVNQENTKEKSNQDLEIASPTKGNEEVIQQNSTGIAETNSSTEITTEDKSPQQQNTNNSNTKNQIATTTQQNAQRQNTNVLTTSNTEEVNSSIINKNTQNNQATNSNNTGIAYNSSSPFKDRNLIAPTTSKNNTSNNSSNTTSKDNNTAITNSINDSNNTSIATSENDNKKDLTIEAQKINDLKEKEEETTVAQTNVAKTSKWNVGAIAAPVYYGDFGGSGLDNQFSDNSKTGDVNLSYGVQVSYAVSPKLKVRTGVSTVDLSYSTNGVSFSTSGQGRSLSSVNFLNDVETLVIADAAPQELLNSFISQPEGVIGEGSLEQRFNYIEIPMEAVYTISDKRVGFSVIGGVSTLLLNDNQVLLSSDEVTTALGTSSAVNDVSFSTNIGIGIDYKMTDKLQLNVEPSFKYQLNAFDSDAVDFNPYYLGVYTGISYKF